MTAHLPTYSWLSINPAKLRLDALMLVVGFCGVSLLLPDTITKEVAQIIGISGGLMLFGLADRSRSPICNPLLVVLAIHLFTFPVQGLFYDLDFASLRVMAGDAEFKARALDLSALSALAFTLGFCVTREAKTKSAAARPATPPSPLTFCRATCLLLFGWILGQSLTIYLNGGVATAYLPNASLEQQNSSVLMVFTILTQLGAIGLLWAVQHKSMGFRLTLSMKALLAAGLGLQILTVLGAGAKAKIIELALILLITSERKRWLEGKQLRMPLRYVAVAIVSLLSFAVIGPYRRIATADANTLRSDSLIQNLRVQIGYFGQACKEGLLGEEDINATVQTVGTTAQSRLSNLSSLIRVLGYLHGKSNYEDLSSAPGVILDAFIPRAILPEKTVHLNSGEFARLNGWKFGGLSMTLIGSMFWTASWPGVAIGFAALGAIAGWFWARTLAGGPAAHVAFAMCVLQILEPLEGNWQATAIDLMRFWTALTMLFLVLRLRRK